MTQMPNQYSPPPMPLRKPPVRSMPLLVLGIVATVLGLGLGGVGLLVAASPMLLFLFGGGGDTDAFAEFAAGPQTVGGIIAIVGLVLVVAGVVGIVIGARRRPRA